MPAFRKLNKLDHRAPNTFWLLGMLVETLDRGVGIEGFLREHFQVDIQEPGLVHNDEYTGQKTVTTSTSVTLTNIRRSRGKDCLNNLAHNSRIDAL